MFNLAKSKIAQGESDSSSSLDWSTHLEYEWLRREAEAQLREPAPEFPAEVFAR
jgi:hypothetical protein